MLAPARVCRGTCLPCPRAHSVSRPNALAFAVLQIAALTKRWQERDEWESSHANWQHNWQSTPRWLSSQWWDRHNQSFLWSTSSHVQTACTPGPLAGQCPEQPSVLSAEVTLWRHRFAVRSADSRIAERPPATRPSAAFSHQDFDQNGKYRHIGKSGDACDTDRSHNGTLAALAADPRSSCRPRLLQRGASPRGP